MTARSKAIDIVAAMGGEMNILHDSKTIPAHERIHEVELYTPAGLAWHATGCHTMILRYEAGAPIDWNDVLAEIEQGTQPCGIDCEWDDDCDTNRPEKENAHMSKITFNKSNRIGDDVTYDVEEVARLFWASPEAADWLERHGLRLERLSMAWAMETLGGWSEAEEWTAAFEAIHAAMPREKTS